MSGSRIVRSVGVRIVVVVRYVGCAGQVSAPLKGAALRRIAGVMQELITEFKFKGRSHLALPLGELVSVAAYKVTEGWSPAAVVPIPLQQPAGGQRV